MSKCAGPKNLSCERVDWLVVHIMLNSSLSSLPSHHPHTSFRSGWWIRLAVGDLGDGSARATDAHAVVLANCNVLIQVSIHPRILSGSENNIPSAAGAATGAAMPKAAMERTAATTVVNFILTRL